MVKTLDANQREGFSGGKHLALSANPSQLPSIIVDSTVYNIDDKEVVCILCI